MKQQQILPDNKTDEPSPLFAQMLRENSGRALEWLRAADYMPDDEERRYCLEQASSIDPTDTTAQGLLLLLYQSRFERERPSLFSVWSSLGHLLQAIFTTTILSRSARRDIANETPEVKRRGFV